MSAGRRARPAEQRLRRLLVMLPWLMEQGSVPIDEVAERFDLAPADVIADLELVSMCGLPPFVDELIDVFIDEGMVHVGVPRLFTRPLRLNSQEAFELLVAGRAAMQLPGADAEGPLGRGLRKVEAVLGDLASDAGVTVDLDRPAIADDLVAAASRGERLRLRYWSASTDEMTERRVTPRRVHVDRGNWYLDADDERSGEIRSFRLDRLESFEPTGDRVAPSDVPLPEPGRWFDGPDVPRLTLRLRPAARWVIERYPVDAVGEAAADGSVEVTLPVVSDRWLARLLMRLGPDVEVIDPPAAAAVGRVAAAQVLAIYRRS